MMDPTERFRQYVADSAELVANDFAALLNRAAKLNIAICPDIDNTEGVSYSADWWFDSKPGHFNIEWDTAERQWKAARA